MNKQAQLLKNAKSAALFVLMSNCERDGVNPPKKITKLWWELNSKSYMTPPAAACRQCGGWSVSGGMSQYRTSKDPVLGRVGCICHGGE